MNYLIFILYQTELSVFQVRGFASGIDYSEHRYNELWRWYKINGERILKKSWASWLLNRLEITFTNPHYFGNGFQSLCFRLFDTHKGAGWFIYYGVTKLTSFHEFLPLKTQSQSRDLIPSERITSYSLKTNSDQLFFFHLTKKK